jgi:hypothetical protein
LYISHDNSYNQKISLVGDKQIEDYQKYDIPLIPQSYSVYDIKNVIVSTKGKFNSTKKDLVLADLNMNVLINTLLVDENITFDLGEGDKNGIFAYEVEKSPQEVTKKDFVHVMSSDEILRTYPRFVGIDTRYQCRKINKKIFKAIRFLLLQTFPKSITREYEKYDGNFDDAYNGYINNLDPADCRFKLKIQYKDTVDNMKTIRLFNLKKEGFNPDEEIKKVATEGLQEAFTDVQEYEKELKTKYEHKTEEEIKRMIYSIDVDLEEEPFASFDELFPNCKEIEALYVIMPSACDFDELMEEYNRKVYQKSIIDEKIYLFSENSIETKIRRVTEKCVKCKKNVPQTHFISETIQLPKYLIIYAHKSEEKRLVMPDRIKPFKKKCLYELKGFVVFEEKDKDKLNNDLTTYFRKDKGTWIKLFNSLKELEYISELQQEGNLDNDIACLKQSKDKVNDVLYGKEAGGFAVKYEDQYLHKYLYKALIYKLIAK